MLHNFFRVKARSKTERYKLIALIEIAIKTKRLIHLSCIYNQPFFTIPLVMNRYIIKFTHSFRAISFKYIVIKNHKKEKILFGVSHSRLYYDSAWITVKECGPGTMFSINNSNSKIGHHDYILQTIGSFSPLTYDLIFEFGEIDLRAHTLKMSRKLNVSPMKVIDDAINNYMNFITQFSALGYTIYISGPHCGGGKGINSKATEQQEE